MTIRAMSLLAVGVFAIGGCCTERTEQGGLDVTHCDCVPDPRLTLGATCVGRDDCDVCQSSLACNAATTRCEMPRANAAGQPCGFDGNCMMPLVCNAAPGVRVCESVGLRVEGEACSQDDNCQPGLVCSETGAGKVCDLEGQVAELCLQDSDCIGGLVCNTGYTPHECHPPGAVGARCGGRAEDCESGLTCDRSVVPYVCR